MNLTTDQLSAVAQGEPYRFHSNDVAADFVVLRAEDFDRLLARLDLQDFSPQETYPFVDQTMAEDDANDPLLDSYQKYRR